MKNKLSLLVILLMTMFHYASVAQVSIRPGVRGGASFSRINDIEGDARTSFYVGGYAAVKLAKWYTLQPELNYSSQGMKVRYADFWQALPENGFDPVLGGNREETWKLSYLGLTINNKFHPVAGLSLMAGPYVDFLVSHANVKPTNNFDIGLNLGLGYEFRNGLGVEVRFRPGMVDIFEDYENGDYTDGDRNYWNSAFQIGATYTFNLNKK